MISKISFCLTLAIALVAPPTLAQSQDAAAERARLANQRIFAETERRKREEAAAQQEAATELAATAAPIATVSTQPVSTEATLEPAAASASPVEERPPQPEPALSQAPATIAAAEVSGSAAARPVATEDVSYVLEQLDSLGELREKGYVTEEEFERIKRRLLEGY